MYETELYDMDRVRKGEQRAFFRAVSVLNDDSSDQQAIDEQKDELSAIALHTDQPALRVRAHAALTTIRNKSVGIR